MPSGAVCNPDDTVAYAEYIRLNCHDSSAHTKHRHAQLIGSGLDAPLLSPNHQLTCSTTPTFIDVCLLGAPSKKNSRRLIWHLKCFPEEKPPCIFIFETEVVVPDQMNDSNLHDQGPMPSTRTGGNRQISLSVLLSPATRMRALTTYQIFDPKPHIGKSFEPSVSVVPRISPPSPVCLLPPGTTPGSFKKRNPSNSFGYGYFTSLCMIS